MEQTCWTFLSAGFLWSLSETRVGGFRSHAELFRLTRPCPKCGHNLVPQIYGLLQFGEHKGSVFTQKGLFQVQR